MFRTKHNGRRFGEDDDDATATATAIAATARGPGAATTVVCLSIAPLMTAISTVMSPGLLAMGDAQMAQILQTLPCVTIIIGAATTGMITARVGRRFVLTAMLLLYALSGALGSIAPNLAWLAVSRLLLGFAGGSVLTMGYALLGQSYSGAAREKMLGIAAASGALSAVVFLLLAGGLVDMFGWRSPFLIYLGALLMLPFARKALPARIVFKAPGARLQVAWKPLWSLYLLLVVYSVGMFMSIVQLPVLAGAKGVISATSTAILVSISTSVAAVVSSLYGQMRRFLNFRAMFAVISASIGLGAGVAALGSGFTGLVSGAVIMGVGMAVIDPTVMSELFVRTPTPSHEQVIGFAFSAIYIGQLINPWVLSPLRSLYGAEGSFLVIACAFLIGGLGFTIATLRRGVRGRRPAVWEIPAAACDRPIDK